MEGHLSAFLIHQCGSKDYTALPHDTLALNTAMPYRRTMQTVIETDSYLRDAKDAGMAEEERNAAVDLIAADPEAGDVMQGTGGVRKTRLAGRGKGKSGGYRIVWYFGGGDIPVFLITVFGKGEKANLTQGERNALRSMTATLRSSLGARRLAKEGPLK
jgi:hypothetical protein